MSATTLIQTLIDKQSNFNSLIGIVDSYNQNDKTANVQPLVSNGNDPMPMLVSVPHSFMKLGQFSIYAPLQKGDLVVVLFLDCDSDNSFISGQFSKANSQRKHSLDDSIIIGTFTSLNSGNDMIEENLYIKGENNSITLKNNGDIDIKGNTINIDGNKVYIPNLIKGV